MTLDLTTKTASLLALGCALLAHAAMFALVLG